jgi:phosphatidylglycerol:prolipoprotein diacylglycerol transferase
MHYFTFPAWLKPEIFPFLPVRWYGLMYIFAFATAYLAYRKQVRERRFPMNDDQLYGLFFWGILGLVLGARNFSSIIYDDSGVYLRQPWLIFWPFRNGHFVGWQGMSYHGGVIGGLLAFTIYSIVKKFDMREIGDMFGASIPLGYTWGRLGNFINGELYGRVASGPLGMVFPNAEKFSPSLEWVQERAAYYNIPITDALVNLPRYPSQVFEMLFEGVLLWAVVWLFRNRKPFKGFLMGLYVAGYGLVRFFIEYFREPDAHLGYRIQFGEQIPLSEIAQFHPIGSLSTGQLLCLGMVAFAAVWMLVAARLPDAKPVIYYPETAEPEAGSTLSPEEAAAREAAREARRKAARKARKRLH